MKHSSDTDALFMVADIGEIFEVDLHGMDAYSAGYEVDARLNAVYSAGERVVKIIHGTGTGILRETVRKLLDDHPLVAEYRPAAQPQSAGATVAVFKRKRGRREKGVGAWDVGFSLILFTIDRLFT